ncbi:MAG: hypothetical protein ACREQ2_19385 [Candidatus Binatia bacterium]
MTKAKYCRRVAVLVISCGLMGVIGLGRAQEQPAPPASRGPAEMNLRKSVIAREFQGRRFAGEERQIARGDSLWRILVEEKGLPERRFHSYLVVIRGLNPQVKSLDVLRVGDRLFIPLRLDEVEQAPSSPVPAAADRDRAGSGQTVNYRIKEGDYLYRILREHMKFSDQRKLAQYYALVKDLNPERKDWDNLLEGDVIRLPVTERNLQTVNTESGASKPAQMAAAPAPAAIVSAEPAIKAQAAPLARATVEQIIRSPARENMRLFAQVVKAMGNDIQLSGEEVVALPQGTVRFDTSSYPVIYNAALRQKIVIDPDGKIPASLRTKLSDPSIGTAVLPLGNGLSLQDAVRQLLAGLGYQPLPAGKPIVVQKGGIAFEAKGSWMALAPEVSNRTQELLVINLVDSTNEIPDYLKAALANHGLDLREIVLPQPVNDAGIMKISKELKPEPTAARNLPSDKREVVDALLLSFGVTFGVAENISVELRDGLRMDKRADRLFELSGRRTAFFFQPLDPAIRQALQDKHGIQTLELEIDSLSSRDVIARVLSLLGDQVAYREHRFSATAGSAPDRLTVKAWGFHVARKAMFVTDRQIPPALHRFFFEKGLEIVYFH